VKLLACKFESSRKDESRAQSSDSTKAYRNLVLLIVVLLNWASRNFEKMPDIFNWRRADIATRGEQPMVFVGPQNKRFVLPATG